MNNNPFAPMFELQRQSIEQGQKMIEQSIEVQNEMSKSFVKAAESQKSAQEEGINVWKSATETSLTVANATTPTDSTAFTDMQETVGDQFDALSDIHTEAWESAERNIETGTEVSEDMNEIFLSFVNDSVEMAMKTNKQFEEQSETVVDATEFETQ
jgi:hypothetical protein